MNGTALTICGNLAETPTLEASATGKATVRMRIAVDNRRRDPNGEWVDGTTSWYTVIAWETLAENLAANLNKGDRVIVHGRLEQREWTTDDNETRTVWELTAEDAGPSLRMPTRNAGVDRRNAQPARPNSAPTVEKAGTPARNGRPANWRRPAERC
ncbi:MAG TPA: single-stranded DNA-binding protein [Sporichthyaceae bacterium]|jgi:single-strand DNA-binding protein|nr:single-stranded DNA-binding protein [Sporichthyaceae bacterium]